MNILVSACLLGLDCRYSGDGKYMNELEELKGKVHFIPVCPEQLGGLPTPRNPVELNGGKALDKDGRDCTERFYKGAEEACKLADYFDCKAAILKANSPSCGYGQIYDGSFQGKLVQGNGVTAGKLAERGVRIFSEKNLKELKES